MEIAVLLVFAAGAVAAAALVAVRPGVRAVPVETSLVRPPSVPALPVADFAPPAVADRLRRAGVVTARDVLDAEAVRDADPSDLQQVRRIARLVSIPNVGRDEAALLAACGVRAPDDLLAWSPVALARRLNEANLDLGLVEGDLTPGEVRQWLESARVGHAAAAPRHPSEAAADLSQPSIARRRENGPAGVA